MRDEMALFEISDTNELVLCTKHAGNERDFIFKVPQGYQPSESMPNCSYSEWLMRIQQAAARREITAGLADKLVRSLQGLPDLLPAQKACVSFSVGKDSAAVFILARMRYKVEQLLALFADTKDEWPETYAFQPIFERWIGMPVVTLESEGIHTLLRERMPFWPMMGRRHCTKELKMLPQRDYLDQMGYDQVRLQGRAKEPRKARFRNGDEIDVKFPAPLMLCGERWGESETRSRLPLISRDETMLRFTQRPVLEFSIEEVWELIFWLQAPYNPVYMHVQRCACAGCPFASRKEIEKLGEYHPDKLNEWVETERIIGHPWKRIGFASIKHKLELSGRFGSKNRHYRND